MCLCGGAVEVGICVGVFLFIKRKIKKGKTTKNGK